MLVTLYTIASLAACALAQVMSADPNPPILSPNSATIWTVGATETVTWDTTGILVTDQDGKPLPGKVVLGFLKADGASLYQSTPLAQGFPLTGKQVQLVVPEVPSGVYFITLEGDAGNWSQGFTITNPSEPSGTPPSSISVIPPPSSSLPASTPSASSPLPTSTSSASSPPASSAPPASGASAAVPSGPTSAGSSSAPAAGNATAGVNPSVATVLPSASASTMAVPNGARRWTVYGSVQVAMLSVAALFVAGVLQ